MNTARKRVSLDGLKRQPKTISISTMRPSFSSERFVIISLLDLNRTLLSVMMFVTQILQNDQWSTSVKEEDADKLELNGKGGNAVGDKKRGGCC